MNTGRFSGFPPETFAFLADLARNNNKPWFDRNKDRYKEYVEAPAHAFMDALEWELEEKFPDIGKTHGKLFRIYRDTRFSKDKTPYKTHIGIRAWTCFAPRACMWNGMKNCRRRYTARSSPVIAWRISGAPSRCTTG